jgi:diguanylate cyclase (GGDEF)-like protein
MKGKKRSNWSLVFIAILIMIVSIVLYNLFNPQSSNGEIKLNLFEQRWIQNNKNKVINVLIPNNIPLFSSEGTGVIFSFLEYLQDGTELDFNKTPYTIGENDDAKDNQFRILRSDDKLNNNDLLFYSDNYVVVSKTSEKRLPLDELNGKIGLLDEDFDDVSSYLVGEKLTFTKVTDITALIKSFNSGEVSYIIIPKNLYLNVITANNYYILNTLTDLSLKYVLTLKNNDNRLNDIIKKYYNVWIESYLADDYYDELLNLYTSTKEVDDKSKTDFKSKRYIYGYVDTLPYEVNKNSELNGISSEFINSFMEFSDVEFNFKRYKNVDELNRALENGQIDIALNYYNLNTTNTYKTLDVMYSNYVILSNDKTRIIDTIKSLKGKPLYTVEDTRLSNYMKKNGNFEVKEVDKISSLDGYDLILLDATVYQYYKDVYFNDYNIVYQNTADTNYSYIINKTDANTLFYNILNYYLSTVNFDQYKNVGMNKMLTKTLNIDLSLLWLYVILIPAFIGVIILVSRKRKRIIKVRNDVKLKYIDPLTSLKNRYYLSNNIAKWEENNIYPQAIVVVNVNNLKDINDAYGYEGGDQLIKTAANILINNQIEKTDIIRTDGNEFVIYLVGYDESSVIAYVRKLYRLLKDLPYEYGASLGYSMIEDDIKTIEDAINEAILDMVTNRETKRNSDL